MSSIHDQAMHYIYQQVLQRLLDHMSQAQRASVQLLIQRLLVAAGGLEYIGEFRLLVLHANDPRSAHLLATLRAAQLSIALRGPETFHLRVVVGCQPALRDELLDDHERAFSALFLQDDPRVELLMLRAGQVQPFSARRHPVEGGRSLPAERQGILLFGHLSGGRPEALLGSRLHLELAEACQQLLAWKGGASALVTAIPERQRRRYLAWARAGMRLAGERGLPGAHQCAGALCEALARLNRVAASPLDPATTHSAPHDRSTTLRLIAVDELLPPQGDNDRLVHMLGMRHLASAATLGAFFDPLALAYLRGLQEQLLHGAGESPCSQAMREQARALFQQTYGIGDSQLACLLFTPFNHRGRGLGLFLKRCHPSMRVALPYLHQALQGKPCPDTVQNWLLDTSGLTLAQLRALYAGRVAPSAMHLLDGLALRDAHLRLLPRPAVFSETKAWAVT